MKENEVGSKFANIFEGTKWEACENKTKKIIYSLDFASLIYMIQKIGTRGQCRVINEIFAFAIALHCGRMNR